MKTALTIQDLSCLGRASGAVALGVLPAMGIEAVLLPTAVLSTHTMFPAPAIRELSDFLEPAAAHWQGQDVRFDAIATGYLRSPGQCQQVLSILSRLTGPETLIVVDPAMGDHGRLYAGLSPDHPRAMAQLTAAAQVLLPNLTEAALLTGLPMDADPRDLCRALRALGCQEVLLTGITPAPGSIGTMHYDGQQFTETAHSRLPAAYPGTGDLFASVYLGARLQALPSPDAAALAGQWVAEAMARTMTHHRPVVRGVEYEPLLWKLGQRIAERSPYGNGI